MAQPKLVVLTGPTASGKSGLALRLAGRFGAEIVSADSQQVYRRLDIGTAKPTQAEQLAVPHHVIDVAEPHESFDAARYIEHADRAIADIAARGKRALVVGGTGLYIRALLHGLHEAPPPDASLRAALQGEAAALGWPALHVRLAAVDPDTAARLHPNDGTRISRALEVHQTTGIPMSKWQASHGFSRWRYEALLLGLDLDREVLRRRVFERVDRMMEGGFLEEVKGLLASGVDPHARPMGSLGYKQLVAHLRGEMSLEDAVQEAKLETRRFAKRQLTWLKREQKVEWVAPEFEQLETRVAQAWQDEDARALQEP